MAKGIIVLDVPECCEDCPCCYSNDYNYRCRINWKRVDWDKRPDWCPIRPMPEKKDTYLAINSNKGYCEGWNACIDEIMKEDKEE